MLHIIANQQLIRKKKYYKKLAIHINSINIAPLKHSTYQLNF